MTRKKLLLSLIAAGLVVTATSVAFTIYPPNWLTRNSPASTPVPAATAPDEQPGQLGLALRPLTGDEQARATLQGGLLIQGVSGAAARAGLVPGEVLLAINGVTVKSVEQVANVMNRKPKSVALLILRNGERVFVPVEPG